MNVLDILTAKDDKIACAYANRIVNESQTSNDWYNQFDEFAKLLSHSKSLIRNRALIIIASIVKWDEYNKFDMIFDDYVSHIQDEKPITARQCIKNLVVIGKSKPKYVDKILHALKVADISKYNDSMRPLIENDILITIKSLID